MRLQAALTFESKTQPPRTYRAEFTVPGALRAVSRLLREAKKHYPGTRWDSLSIILQKDDVQDPQEESEEASEGGTEGAQPPDVTNEATPGGDL